MTTTANTSFSRFVFHRRSNQLYLLSLLLVSPLLWILFKHFYPQPNIIFDSYHYIKAAATGVNVNAWPIGYSWFIRFIGLFSHSANILLFIQYLVLQVCFGFFFFSYCFLFQPSKYVSLAAFLFLLFNPIFLFTSNLILSDTLFTALSITWVIQLCWLVFCPKSYMLYTQALLLLAAFAIRYNALYYPFVAALAFLFSPLTPVKKISGIALQFLLLFVFISFTSRQMKSIAGVQQFSPFGGWKLASDALYMYEHVYLQSDTVMPLELQPLDKRVRHYFSRPHQPVDLLIPDPTWGSYYMYMYPSPLITHMHSLYGADSYPLDFRHFANMGPLYQRYGAYLVKKHPLAFIRYFILPNIQRYIAPHQEVYVDDKNPFHLRKDILSAPSIQWFRLTTLQVSPIYIQARTKLFSLYPALTALIHYYFLLVSVLLLALRKKLPLSKPVYKGILLIIALWLCDFGFNVLAAGVVMRYQLCIIAVEFAFSLLFTGYLLQYKPEQPGNAP